MTSTDRRRFLEASGALALLSALPRGSAGEFAPPIGVCRGLDHAEVAAKAGASFLEVSCGSWLVPAEPEELFAPKREALLHAVVPARAANSFLPGKLRSTGPEADPEAVLAYAEVAFRRAAEVGIETITFGSSASRSVPDGFPHDQAELQFAALLGRLGDAAGKHGVTLSVEALQASETNFLRRVEQAARIVRAVNHPHVRLTADLFHMLREGEGAQSIRDASEWIHHVHVAEKAERTPPGRAGDDFRPYLRALREIGYTGRISIECRWEDLARELPVGLRTLREQLATLD